MMVFINPGHALNGNPDPGACGYELKESDVASNIGKLVATQLENAGITVSILQSDSLSEITRTANNWSADIFVSIHCNAFNGSAKRTEVCVYRVNSQGGKLAEKIQRAIVHRLGTVDRGLKERLGLYVLKNTDMPAVLIEIAFIDQVDDNFLLKTKQDVFVTSITEGILSYVGINAVKNLSNTRTIASNGKPYEQNDIDYLIKRCGYSFETAIWQLSQADKYMK